MTRITTWAVIDNTGRVISTHSHRDQADAACAFNAELVARERLFFADRSFRVVPLGELREMPA